MCEVWVREGLVAVAVTVALRAWGCYGWIGGWVSGRGRGGELAWR